MFRYGTHMLADLGPFRGYEVLPTAKHSATVIWCHGLGGNGGEYIPDISVNLKPGLPHVKWILPNAPEREVTINYGAIMPAWYDVYQAGPRVTTWPTREDETGLFETVNKINELISKEVANGILSERIVLAGISQGGTVAFATALTSQRKLGGLGILSSYLFCRARIQADLSPHAKSLPIFIAHGTADAMVVKSRYDLTLQALKDLMRIGLAEDGKWKEGGIMTKMYDGLRHEINDEEMRDLRAWLQEILPATEGAGSEVVAHVTTEEATPR